MNSNQIRQQFLDFFRSKAHDIVPSSPVVPHDDPTLMFANAGMNQFKPIFLGTVDRNSAFGRMKRAADTQKCIRAGGKHNDLDDVGQDTYHHTFFEMLGNWSFGDYFKKEAIEWAWELLTEVWKIDKTRLHATYFEGDAAEGLEPDSEAAELWRTVTDIDPSHIHPGNKKDNFWEMGDTGPCGPCSEIHIDLTPDRSGAPLVNAGDARVIEIWNLVFIQFNRGPDGTLSPLPAKHVDTGMGFERLCAVLQGTPEPQASACADSANVETLNESEQSRKLGGVGHAHHKHGHRQAGSPASLPMPPSGSGPSRELKLAARVFSNYDTDVFTPIFDAIQERTGAPDYTATLPEQNRDDVRAASASERSDQYRDRKGAGAEATEPGDQSKISGLKSQIMVDVSYRVIADHVRCLTFALTDGAIPSNEGRGYVLRRILRRGVRYGRQYMNMHEPFLCDLVEPLVNHMGDVFPELRTGMNPKRPIDNVKHVADILRDEEASFLKTLDRGIKLFNEAADHAQRHHHGKISGEDAFKLHDTYGFPIDLTELMAEEQGLTIDIGEYERLMAEAREKARKVVSMSGSIHASSFATATLSGIPSTDDSLKYNRVLDCEGIIQGAVVDGRIRSTEPINEGTECAISLNKTCFYAEQGGQIGDRGIVRTETGEFEVLDTQRVDQAIIHIGRVSKGKIGSSQTAQLMVGPSRLPTMQNHTATHLLNWALREMLCPAEEREHPHVQQKGSLVDPEKTRFDFSHNKPVGDDELARIESLVNEHIQAGLTVYTNNNVEVDQAKARQVTGLRAVFGEKYPDRVRVVSIGVPVDDEDLETVDSASHPEGVGSGVTLLNNSDNPEWLKYSIEFCGGTHVSNTKEIEAFVLTEESGVAKGVRRVVGVSGKMARDAREAGEALLSELNALAGKPPVAPETGESKDSLCSGGAGDSDQGHCSQSSGTPADLAARVAAFQEKVNNSATPIPIGVRHTIRERLAALQKIVKEQEKSSAAESGEAVMERVAQLLEQAGACVGRPPRESPGALVRGGGAGSGAICFTIGDVVVIVSEVPAAKPDALRGAIDWVRNKTKASAVLLACVDDGKVTLMAGMSKDVVSRGVKAGDLIKEIAPLVGGRGGGRPDMAQGGGSDPGGVENAMKKAGEWISSKLG